MVGHQRRHPALGIDAPDIPACADRRLSGPAVTASKSAPASAKRDDASASGRRSLGRRSRQSFSLAACVTHQSNRLETLRFVVDAPHRFADQRRDGDAADIGAGSASPRRRDGIGHHHGFELGILDPRHRAARQHAMGGIGIDFGGAVLRAARRRRCRSCRRNRRYRRSGRRRGPRHRR